MPLLLLRKIYKTVTACYMGRSGQRLVLTAPASLNDDLIFCGSGFEGALGIHFS
jgi:hypothetical protein